jgi:hypothetical protein
VKVNEFFGIMWDDAIPFSRQRKCAKFSSKEIPKSFLKTKLEMREMYRQINIPVDVTGQNLHEMKRTSPGLHPSSNLPFLHVDQFDDF